ncbi:Salmonella virulence plasmid 28.1kDa A protein [Cedecea neteri]|uniref:Salmonella virulence plasmid 28.1kDa A protein n=1 Tax=Cedecea neteri TaxID=158822 RepID=A0A291DTI9_9ENTR|nr:neuraminidase-like domain-containing protein [Cedecea neteri]ATF91150.1 toxin [Cedecea neteri]SQA99601.1 Salmonella virulence plasmid 28.1kDa A protein [Cedecea neteri]
MLNTGELLSKINESNNNDEEVLLASLQHLSFSEIQDKYSDVITYSQAKHIFDEAQEAKKANTLLETRVFTRANPQLPDAIRAGIASNIESQSYDEMFGSRSSSFVLPGSVASMFSPAGYLTELYREAKDLFVESSAFNLQVRRPDLAELVLNQANMDEEISTLTLSNEILLAHVEKETGKTGDKLLQYFASARQAGSLPYHRPYETLRQAILTLDPLLKALSGNPAVIAKADQNALLALLANISPELYAILTEEVTASNAEELFAKNFPASVTPEMFESVTDIANYYGLTVEEARQFVGGSSPENNEEYFDNILTGTITSDSGEIERYRIKREYTDTFSMMKLLYRGNGKFAYSIKCFNGWSKVVVLKNEDTEVGVLPDVRSNIWKTTDLHDFNVEDAKARVYLRIHASYDGNTPDLGSAYFTFESYPPVVFALKLNKAIRLCRAAGLTPDELENIVRAANSGGMIDDKVLNMVFYTLFFRKRYSLSLSDSLILSGGTISQYSVDNQVSVFDQLFNTPPLAGTWFNVSDTASITIDDTSHAHDALLNGLGVTQEELYQLALMAGLLKAPTDKFTLSLKNITALYRLALVARVSALTVNELYLLFLASGSHSTEGPEFVRYIDTLVTWTEEAKLTAEQLWYLTTPDHPITLTPEMINLRSSLQGRVTEADLTAATDDQARCRLVAPYIAGALNLSSPDLAVSLLLWCDTDTNFKLKPFLTLLVSEKLDPGAGKSEDILAGYLHVLGQYALTIDALRLSAAEVAALAADTGKRRRLLASVVVGRDAVNRLLSLYHFHSWINGLGRESGSILATLNTGSVDVAQLASAMGLGETMLTQALFCVTGKNSPKITGGWQTIYQMLQWVNVAGALNTMPVVIKELTDIRLSASGANASGWAQWSSLARKLEAALTAREAQLLAGYSAGRLSDILSQWFISNVEVDGVPVQNRDQLYSYFLIDNKVSPEVITTRIAEAIASVQLHINRALNRIEPNMRSDVSTRQFFTDWEINSRYATWGGISRLVYYPENYVDPLMRVGQTKMMDELLQYINQSQLGEDTVEDAFKNYLARFESVADLKVISTYHDNVNSNTGKTWFVGRTSEGIPEYYFRSADMSRFSHGKLAANAWSEWVKIDAAINAWKDTIRPVIFRDRLYVTWLERDEVASNGSASFTPSWRYTVKLAFLRQDGNWSAPWAYDVTTQVNETGAAKEGEQLGLCASAYYGEDTLMVYIYRLQASYDFSKPTFIRGMSIYANGTRREMADSEMSKYALLAATLDVTHGTLGVIRKANYRFAIDYDIPTSLVLSSKTYGNNEVTHIPDAKINSIRFKSSSESLNITLSDLSFSVHYTKDTELQRMTVEAMKLPGLDGKSQWGSEFILPFRSVDWWLIGGNSSKEICYVVYNTSKKSLSLKMPQGSKGAEYLYLTKIDPGRNWINSFEPYNDAFFKVKVSSYSNSELYGTFPASIDKDLSGVVYIVKGWASSVSYTAPDVIVSVHKVDSWLKIDTTLDLSRTAVNVTAGGVKATYSAQQYVSNKPAGSFDEMKYSFNPLLVDGSKLTFSHNQVWVEITCQAYTQNGFFMGSVKGSLRVSRVDRKPDTILHLYETDTGVQYMQYGVYRIRLNTLLAPELVTRASVGIGSILSMATQRLPEPKLGHGSFITVNFPAYNAALHGSSRTATLYLCNAGTVDQDSSFWSGQLTDASQQVTLFVSTSQTDYGDPLQFPADRTKGLDVKLHCQKGWYVVGTFKNISAEDLSLTSFTPSTGHNSARDPAISVLSTQTTQLDFNSSCALYYWELFYYVPMMCFQRMLQEKQFELARKWMNYVWNPQGYIDEGQIALRVWNCRPLEETTSWNANPLDAIDPDAVAQNDPTHYKVATFMRFIELIITRGDMAYRELTRDALNEAKMWYVFALEVMGEEPKEFGQGEWNNPSLQNAARDTARLAHQNTLNHLRAGESVKFDELTANSLTALFLPEYNPALTECWATLRLRLYNLRHNLSIDGQPLSLSIYAQPTDPKALQASQVMASENGRALPAGTLSLYRFPVMLERARNLTSQLEQFGSALMRLAENSDADEFNTLLLQQGMELMAQSVHLQERAVAETEADIEALKVTRQGAQMRLDKYTQLYDADVSAGERQAMNLANTAGGLAVASQAMSIVGGALDMAPNVFGFACGGSRWGAVAHAASNVMALQSTAMQINADKVGRSEMYRRRREEWGIQRDNEQNSIDQIDAQLLALDIRREAASLQVEYLETQQVHTQAQLEFMQRKFTSRALQSWMRGKLSAIYYQFFDITQSFCLMAQEALRRELNDGGITFIRGSAWNGNSAGLMAGETLQLNLAEMEKTWFERETRTLEVTRTVSLAQVYAGLSSNKFDLKAAVTSLIGTGTKPFGSAGNEVKINAKQELEASVSLKGLNINGDYHQDLGKLRLIKQISVTLPALVGPYEDVRAVLNYGGSVLVPRGCDAIAISHGMNDSGQFVLDFNDSRYLPFEGIPVDDAGSLALSFPAPKGAQKDLLASLSDIILHIRYTIRA